MYHAESDSHFKMDASELPAFYSRGDADAQLCVDVTGMPEHER